MTFKENNQANYITAPGTGALPQRHAGYVGGQGSGLPAAAPVQELTLAQKQARSQLARQSFIAPAVTDETFQALVLDNPKPSIVLFGDPRCGSCTSLKMGAWQDIYKNHSDQFNMFEYTCTPTTKIDKDEDVGGHPTMLFYSKGNRVGVYLGFSQYEYYANYIKILRL